jgi:HSP20 family protein
MVDTQTMEQQNQQQDTPQMAGQAEATPQTTSGDGNQQTITQPQQGQLEQRGSRTNDPLSFMHRLSNEIDDLFENFGFGRSPLLSGRTSLGPSWPRDFGMTRQGSTMWAPQIEVEERGNQLVVRADLPGLKKDDVKVEVNDTVMTISGERKEEREEKREGFYHSERSYGTFARRIPLPEGVNPDEVKAAFNNGVLEITMPAPPRPQSRSRQIEIQGS